MTLEFEWDDAKAAANLHKHDISFEQAMMAVRDPFAVDWIDTREVYGEERAVLLGVCGREVLYVVYTFREGRYRIISARRARKNEQDNYYRQNAP